MKILISISAGLILAVSFLITPNNIQEALKTYIVGKWVQEGNTINDILNMVIISSYSKAKYKAMLTKIGEEFRFNLGEPIVKDIHFYPRKPVKLSER